MPSRPLFLAVLILTGCSGQDRKPASNPEDAEITANTPEEEAGILGRELYSLIDQAMSYKSSHRGRLPRSLRDLGIDALTSSTSRTLTVSGDEPTVTVEFRNLESHSLRSCRGNSDVLEEAAIGGGDFSVICITTTGGSTTLRARR